MRMHSLSTFFLAFLLLDSCHFSKANTDYKEEDIATFNPNIHQRSLRDNASLVDNNTTGSGGAQLRGSSQENQSLISPSTENNSFNDPGGTPDNAEDALRVDGDSSIMVEEDSNSMEGDEEQFSVFYSEEDNHDKSLYKDDMAMNGDNSSNIEYNFHEALPSQEDEEEADKEQFVLQSYSEEMMPVDLEADNEELDENNSAMMMDEYDSHDAHPLHEDEEESEDEEFLQYEEDHLPLLSSLSKESPVTSNYDGSSFSEKNNASISEGIQLHDSDVVRFALSSTALNSYGYLRSALNSGYCIAVQDSRNNVNRHPVVLKPCDYSSVSQRWKKDNLGRLVHNAGKCMEAGAAGNLYAKMYIYSCHTGMHQRWTFQSDGRIKNKKFARYIGIAYCNPITNRPIELRNYEDGTCGTGEKWIERSISSTPSSNWQTLGLPGHRTYGGWFSEDKQWGTSYSTGGIIYGVRCSGRYCDNKRLYYAQRGARSPLNPSARGVFTDWFSEERKASMRCSGNRLVTQVHCRGDYCDDIRFICSELAQGYRVINSNVKMTTVTDENKFRSCPNGYYLIGARCHGRYCDDFQMFCALVQYDKSIDKRPIVRPTDSFLAHKFAPEMYFDQKSNQYPMSIKTYWENSVYENGKRVLKGRYSPAWSSWRTQDMGLSYTVTHCAQRTMIVYHIFYKGQRTCGFWSGDHEGDWERVTVELTSDFREIFRVRYNQHAGWFTRVMGTFPFRREDNGTHPKVYVGKNSNGSYNDDGGSGGCAYWEDYRNTGNSGKILKTWKQGTLLPTSDTGKEWNRFNGSWGRDGFKHPNPWHDNQCNKDKYNGCGGGFSSADGCRRLLL